MACAGCEWAPAVRKLVQLGGRANLARATQITVHTIPTPRDKVRVRVCVREGEGVSVTHRLIPAPKMLDKAVAPRPPIPPPPRMPPHPSEHTVVIRANHTAPPCVQPLHCHRLLWPVGW